MLPWQCPSSSCCPGPGTQVFLRDKLLHSCSKAGLLAKPEDVVPDFCYHEAKAKALMDGLSLGKEQQACGPYLLDITCRAFPPPRPRKWLRRLR